MRTATSILSHRGTLAGLLVIPLLALTWGGAMGQINSGPLNPYFYSVQLRGVADTPSGLQASVHVFDGTYDAATNAFITITNNQTAEVIYSQNLGDYGNFDVPGTADFAVGLLPYNVSLHVHIQGREFSQFNAILGNTVVASGGYAGSLPNPVDPVIFDQDIVLVSPTSFGVDFQAAIAELPHARSPFLGILGASGPAAGQFENPSDVKVNPVNGNIAVVDRENHRVQVFDGSGSFLYQIGGIPGPGPGELVTPRAVAFHPVTGDMYVTDAGNHRVQMFDDLGNYLTEVGTAGAPGSGPGQFSFPAGIVFDAPFGDVVLVADTGNHRIQQFTSDLIYLGEFGGLGAGPGQFDLPVGMCLDPVGNIYVTEVGNDRVQHLEPTGFPLETWGSFGGGSGQFDGPAAVQHNGNGRVYVSDTNNNRIQIFDEVGTYLGEINPVGSGQLFNMEGMVFLGPDEFLLANGNNHTVDRFRLVSPGEHNSLVERNGVLHLSTYDPAGGDLIYGTHHGSGTWALELVDEVGDVGRFSSLVLDDAGRPHIAYQLFQSGASELKYAAKFGDIWALETVRSGPGDFGWSSSIGLNAAGEPQIAHVNALTAKVEFSDRSGGLWITDASAGFGAEVSSVSMQTDARNRVHLAYNQGDVPDELRYAVRTFGVWGPMEVVDTGPQIGHVDLVLGTNGSPMIGYQFGGSEVRFAEPLSGGGWETMTVDGPVSEAGFFSDLALDPVDGEPRIAYGTSTTNEIRFAHRKNGAWHLQTAVGNVAGATGYGALALGDDFGNPTIVYNGSLATATGTILNMHYLTPNTVRNDGPQDVTVSGASVGISPPSLVEFQQVNGPAAIPVLNVATTGPNVLQLTLGTDGVPTGGYHLILHNSAGEDTLRGALVVHDETVDLVRATTRVGTDRLARASKPGTVPERLAFMTGRNGVQEIAVKEPFLPDTDANTVIVPSVGAPSGLDWSDDGTRIVFRNDFEEQLYTLTLADGSISPELAGGNIVTPAWSPVDDRILYNKGTISGPIDLFTIESGTDVITQLTFGSAPRVLFSPEFSPDGSRIVYVEAESLSAPRRIVSISASEGEAGGVTTLIGIAGVRGSPAWSPDGQWIAYVSNQNENLDIYIMRSIGAQYGVFQVTSDPADDFTPAWSPDGQSLYFISTRGDPTQALGSDIYIADVSGILTDSDGDLVIDLADACPGLAPGPGEFDRDFDGCPDPFSSFRQPRFWPEDLLPVFYETDAMGDSSITDGSDFSELADAFAAWHTGPLAGVSLGGGDDGTRAGPSDAVSGDVRNSISFSDPDGFEFRTIIALTLSTVAVEDTVIDGRWYRPDEVVDADILFNTFWYDFETESAPGPPGAFSLFTVALHEFGHFFGLTHSPVVGSTMFYVVFRGLEQASLENDDITLAQRGYFDLDGIPPPLGVEGRVLRGGDGTTPVVGAAVFAIDDASGDSSQVTFTGADGTYRFYGSLPTDFRIFVHPMDGTAATNGLTPTGVSEEYAAFAETDFLPEYYDGPLESSVDFDFPGFVINSGSLPLTGADILTNPDLFPPGIVSTSPAEGETTSAGSAITVKFDERIDLGSISASTFFVARLADGVISSGLAGLLKDDSLLVFTPDQPLLWDTDYFMSIGPGIADRFGNAMPSGEIVNFRVGPQPPVHISGVSPAEVPVGGTLVVSGTGFNNGDPSQNLVNFDGGTTAAFAATLEELFVTVPATAMTGSLDVVVSGVPSDNRFPITIAGTRGIPVGTSLGTATLIASPRRVATGPGGRYAYVATDAGISAVNADPGDPGFLSEITDITLGGGSRGAVAMPDGRRVLAVSSSPARLNVIDADLGSLFLNQIDPAYTTALDREPFGIAAVPGGGAVVIAYADRVVKHQVTPDGNFGLPLQEWSQAGVSFLGDIAVSSAGSEVYATTGDGKVAVLSFNASEGTNGIVTYLDAGTQPREVAPHPGGTGFLAVDEAGVIREFDTRGPLLGSGSQDGGYTGLAFSPEGQYAFAANFILNKVDVVDATGSLPAVVTSIPTGIDPQDVTTSFSGRYLLVVTDGADQLEVYDTQVGPVVDLLNPRSGGDGTQVTLIGSGFDPSGSMVSFGGITVAPDRVDPDSSVIVVTQPAGATGDGVSVMSGSLSSNTRPYKVVNRPDEGNLAIAGVVPTGTTETMNLVTLSPTEEYLVTTYLNGAVIVLGGDPAGPDFLSPVQTLFPTDTALPALVTGQTHRTAWSPDGRKFYTELAGGGIRVWSVAAAGTANPFAMAGDVIHDGVPASMDVANLAMTPDGKRLFAIDVGAQLLYEIDAVLDEVVTAISVDVDGEGALAVHPDGTLLFFGDQDALPAELEVNVVDIDPASAGYRTVVGAVVLPASAEPGAAGPFQLAATPDGDRLYALTSEPSGVSEVWRMADIDIDPASPTFLDPPFDAFVALDAKPTLIPNRSETMTFAVSPNDQEILAITRDLEIVAGSGFQVQLGSSYAGAISHDDARLYVPGFGENLLVFDLSAAQSINIFSGGGQIGVVNQPLAAPIVARVTDTVPELAEGALVQFQATPASGTFTNGSKTLLTAADANGFAEANYVAGAVAQEDTINVSAVPGVIAAFVTVVSDTSAQPPQIVGVTPLSTATPGVNTKIAVDFSKAINPATLSTSTFTLMPASVASVVPGSFSRANGGKRVVFTPSGPLAYSAGYNFEVTSGIQDYSSNPLANPGTFTFTTAPEPAGVSLASITPTSGTGGNTMVLAGEGFSPVLSENTVLFNSLAAAPGSGDPGALTVTIPFAVSSGSVRVVVDDGSGPDSSNTMSFTALSTSYTPVSEEIASVSVPSSGQQIAVLPSGAFAYMTSAGANTVVPIDIPNEVSEPPVSVGLHPFAVAAGPSSRRVYASNFFSNTVSVIDAVSGSPTFHDVINTIPTGNNPTGVAVHPDGRTLYVLNYADSTIDFVDIDPTSALFEQARSSINTNSTSKGVTVTPDGATVIVGTGYGLLLLDASDGAARSSINTNSSSKGVTVTPDGAYAVVLTDDNLLILVDISDPTDSDPARSSINTNSTSKGVTVSPDGAFVYVTTEDNTVLVYQIVAIGGGAAVEDPQSALLGFVLVDTIHVGENPDGLVIDPISGTLLVVNSGDKTVSFINVSETSVGELTVDLDMDPNTLNLNSKGRFISGAIEFPSFLDPLDIELDSVLLNGQVAADSAAGVALTDKDEDGIQEAEVKFPRDEVIEIVPEGQMVEIIVTGLHDGRMFAGMDSISIKRPRIKSPAPGQGVPPAAETQITWDIIQDGPADHMDIYLSLDLGETWQTVIGGTDDDGEFTWMVPDTESEEALLMLAAFDRKNALLGYDVMAEPFIIGATTTSVEEALPAVFRLMPPAPNPFLASTSLRFDLPEPAKVTLRLFAVDGSVVRTFADGEEFPAGKHAFVWDGRNDSGQRTGTGVYFMRIQAGDREEAVQKIVRIGR